MISRSILIPGMSRLAYDINPSIQYIRQHYLVYLDRRSEFDLTQHYSQLGDQGFGEGFGCVNWNEGMQSMSYSNR